MPAQWLQRLLRPCLVILRRRGDGLQQRLQILPECRKSQTGEIRRCHRQFDQRIFEMLECTVADAPTDLMMRGCRLNQTLHKETPGFRVATPNLLPDFVRLPIRAGIEQRHAAGKVVAILLTQLRRELRGVRGRRPQAVPAR